MKLATRGDDASGARGKVSGAWDDGGAQDVREGRRAAGGARGQRWGSVVEIWGGADMVAPDPLGSTFGLKPSTPCVMLLLHISLR